ncbi:hypothetical protein TNCV_3976641 [Trichonephila clavipes]|nr:hypothetical protein TNCV_4695131 [Trichonephila clavipes]GFX84319.1 hypothetical protein TNCV_3976641 [Trichonephila clavipes]
MFRNVRKSITVNSRSQPNKIVVVVVELSWSQNNVRPCRIDSLGLNANEEPPCRRADAHQICAAQSPHLGVMWISGSNVKLQCHPSSLLDCG